MQPRPHNAGNRKIISNAKDVKKKPVMTPGPDNPDKRPLLNWKKKKSLIQDFMI